MPDPAAKPPARGVTLLKELLERKALDPWWDQAKENGYSFTMNVSPFGVGFRARATPLSPGASGNRHFSVDESGVIRCRVGAPASSADSPVE